MAPERERRREGYRWWLARYTFEQLVDLAGVLT